MMCGSLGYSSFADCRIELGTLSELGIECSSFDEVKVLIEAHVTLIRPLLGTLKTECVIVPFPHDLACHSADHLIPSYPPKYVRLSGFNCQRSSLFDQGTESDD